MKRSIRIAIDDKWDMIFTKYFNGDTCTYIITYTNIENLPKISVI